MLHFSLSVSKAEVIVSHCNSQHNGSLILLPYLGHTIVSSDGLPGMFTLLSCLWGRHLCVQPSILQNRSWFARDCEYFHLISSRLIRIGQAKLTSCSQADQPCCCVYQCGVVCKYMHMAAHFSILYMWAWAPVCLRLVNEDIQNIRAGTEPSGHGEGAALLVLHPLM